MAGCGSKDAESGSGDAKDSKASEETEVANAFDDVSAGIFGTNTYASYVSRKDFEGTLRTEYLDDAERTLTDELKEELDESIKRKYTEQDEEKFSKWLR